MYRSCISGCIAGIVGLTGMTQAVGQQICRPALAFKEVQFSAMEPTTLERKWTAVVSVDASRCAANSEGYFEIVFSRLKETGPGGRIPDSSSYGAACHESRSRFLG